MLIFHIILLQRNGLCEQCLHMYYVQNSWMCICIVCVWKWGRKGERRRGVLVYMSAYLMHNSPQVQLFSWLMLFILSYQLVHYSELHIFEHPRYWWIKIQLVCILCILFPCASLSSVFPGSAACVQGCCWDDIVVHFKILTLFLHFETTLV